MNDSQNLVVLLILVLALSYLGRRIGKFIRNVLSKRAAAKCGGCSSCDVGNSKIKVVELVGLQMPKTGKKSSS